MAEPMSDEELAEMEARFALYGEHSMNAGCSDYACTCHFMLPKAIREVKRLREENAAFKQEWKTALDGVSRNLQDELKRLRNENALMKREYEEI